MKNYASRIRYFFKNLSEGNKKVATGIFTVISIGLILGLIGVFTNFNFLNLPNTGEVIIQGTPVPFPSGPKLTTSCTNNIQRIDISWSNLGSTADYYVDISTESTFSGQYWHKLIPNAQTTATAPVDETGYYNQVMSPFDIMSYLKPSTIYYFRIAYTSPLYALSQVVSISTGAPCAVITGTPTITTTITPSVSITPTITTTTTTTVTPTISSITAPTVVQVCNGTTDALEVSWADQGQGRMGYFVDVAATSTGFETSAYWHKGPYINPTTTSRIPVDYDNTAFWFINGGTDMPSLTVPGTYYVRIWYGETGAFSKVAEVNITKSACATTTITTSDTPVVPTSIYAAPTVSQVCSMYGQESLAVNWTSNGIGGRGYFVDVTNISNGFETGLYWHKGFSLPNQFDSLLPVDTDNVAYWSIIGNYDMPLLEIPGTYFVRVWYAQTGEFSRVTQLALTSPACTNTTPTITPTLTPIVTTTVTATPTPTVMPTSSILPPTVTQACNGGVDVLNINWANNGIGTNGYWVDIAESEENFATDNYYHKGYYLENELTARAPIDNNFVGFWSKADEKITMPALNLPGSYYVRIWYAQTGTFSQVQRIDLSASACTTPTITPTVSGTPVVTPTGTYTAPIVSNSCISGQDGLNISWQSQGQGGIGYWIQVSTDSTFNTGYWHKKHNDPTSITARAPYDLDGGQFFSSTNSTITWNALATPGIYYVRIWYVEPNLYSNVTTYNIPTITDCSLTVTPTLPATIPAPTAALYCDATNNLGLNISWLENGMGSLGYWVDIADTTFTADYWHKGVGLNRLTATAPKDSDNDSFFRKSDSTIKWTSFITPGTYQVRVWYEATRLFTDVATVTIPDAMTCVNLTPTVLPTVTGSITPTVTENPSVTPTATVIPTPLILAPSLTTACINGQPRINIAWQNSVYGLEGYWVDISDDIAFPAATHWNVQKGTAELTAMAPNEFVLYGTTTAMPSLVSGQSYYVKLWYNTSDSYSQISTIVAPTCATATITPTNTLTPTQSVAAPIVSSTCINNMITMNINWQESGMGSGGYWVDIAQDATFLGQFWHNQNPPTDTSSTAPVDSDGYFLDYATNDIMSSLSPNTNYYVKIWYTSAGVHSPVTTVTTPNLCILATNTNTPVPTNTTRPTNTNAVVPTNTTRPNPTATRVVSPTNTPYIIQTMPPTDIVDDTPIVNTTVTGLITGTPNAMQTRAASITLTAIATMTPKVTGTPTTDDTATGDLGKLFGAGIGDLGKLSFIDCGAILLIIFGALLMISGSLGMYKKYAVQDLPMSESSGNIIMIITGLLMVIIGVIMIVL